MFKKKFISFSLIVLILIISIGAVSAFDNSTELIETNSTGAIIDEGKTFTDIQTAIDESSENDTIELEGIYSSDGNEIKINKSITISSKNGATLDAKLKSNIFNISNVNVHLSNLNFINSNSSNPTIFNQGNLTIINSKFINNTAVYPEKVTPYEKYLEKIAGAIFSTNNLNINNCEFENNQAYIYEWNYGEYCLTDFGGAINSKRNLVINNSKFSESYIESSGILNIINSEFVTSQIYCYDDTSIVNSTLSKTADFKSATIVYTNINITDCNFTSNGGHVISSENQENMANITIIRSNFINNNLECSGFYDYESGEEFNSEFIVISCDNCNISIYNSTFINNTEHAIFNHDGNLYIINSYFSENFGYKGGAIHSSNSTIINSTFINNTASFAGAIYSDELVLINCTFSSNKEGAVESRILAIIDGETYKGLTFFDNSLKKINIVTSKTQKITTTYLSGKTIYIKLIYSESKNPLENYYVGVKITKGKKVYYDEVTTNSKGIAYFKASNLAVGTYKVIFNYDDEDISPTATTVKITKIKTTIKAPKVNNKYKKSKYFKITIKNKATKKVVKNTYVKIKIDKKTYKVKTNSKGIGKFNTKKLKIGKHKVVISSGNSNYIMSAKSTIVIKK